MRTPWAVNSTVLQTNGHFMLPQASLGKMNDIWDQLCSASSHVDDNVGPTGPIYQQTPHSDQLRYLARFISDLRSHILFTRE